MIAWMFLLILDFEAFSIQSKMFAILLSIKFPFIYQ